MWSKNPMKQQLLEKAYQRHGRKIKLCKPGLTEVGGIYILWYNTKDHSTHVIKSVETFEGVTI